MDFKARGLCYRHAAASQTTDPGGGRRPVWTVVYIAPNRPVAERLRDALTREGLLVKLNQIGCTHADGGSSVEILVPEGEVEEALEIISGF